MANSETRNPTGSLAAQAKVLGGTLGIVWLVFIATWLSGGALLSLGIIPRTTIGLRGILFAPFLHGGLAHLIANSIPFLVLGWLVMLRDARHFIPVTLAAMIASGMMAWLLGAADSVHVGASGVIFGYLGFLILSGWYVRSAGSILLSLLVVVLWGGMVVGVMPGQAGISWQGHLGGFLGGVLAAKLTFRALPAMDYGT
ncbi:MAG: rhomboid family intramembrane serine protease [Gemmatimonadaceae bacterium]|nr:rhomboid family intramembrane serine protease [Gemmatimonadaceae bacterium]